MLEIQHTALSQTTKQFVVVTFTTYMDSCQCNTNDTIWICCKIIIKGILKC